jgi:hypothetical protein
MKTLVAWIDLIICYKELQFGFDGNCIILLRECKNGILEISKEVENTMENMVNNMNTVIE